MKPRPRVSETISKARRVSLQAVDEEPDPDHLARPKGVGEAEESDGRHGPGHELVAVRDVEPKHAPERHRHHQEEDGEEEQAREPAGEEVEPVEDAADHAVRVKRSARKRSRV